MAHPFRWTLALLAALALGAQAPAPKRGGDVNRMIMDVMRTDIAAGREVLVLWCPSEFFVAAGMSQAPGQNPADLAKELSFLDDFAVFMAQVKVKDEDGSRALTTATLREITCLVDAKGREIRPVTEIPPKLEALMNAMRTGMGQQAGEGLRILVFPARDADGRLVSSPTQRGTLTIRFRAKEGFAGAQVVYRTPLASFVASAPCRKCTETMQPAWSFCPWCGTSAAAR